MAISIVLKQKLYSRLRVRSNGRDTKNYFPARRGVYVKQKEL